MVNEALRLLGLGAPFIYAAATYAIFHFLDRKASGQAKKTLGQWFTRRYENSRVADAILEVFDRLYTAPLLGVRAFCRSAALSVILIASFIVEFIPGLPRFLHFGNTAFIADVVIPATAANIVSDYLSLFVVRRWLIVAGRSPLFALMVGPTVGAIIILFVFFGRDIILSGLVPTVALIRDWLEHLSFVPFRETEDHTALIFDRNLFLFAALAVHSWLFLFAIGVLAAQAANYTFWAAGKMQWFLKRGHQHPLQAIGYVAAAVLFVTVSVVRHFLM